MGLVTPNGDGLSGLVLGKPDVQIFTANGTWTKPALATRVYIEVIGGGGGGGNSGTAGAGGDGARGEVRIWAW